MDSKKMFHNTLYLPYMVDIKFKFGVEIIQLQCSNDKLARLNSIAINYKYKIEAQEYAWGSDIAGVPIIHTSRR